GIRDRNVTGVQTCALPICLGRYETGPKAPFMIRICWPPTASRTFLFAIFAPGLTDRVKYRRSLFPSALLNASSNAPAISVRTSRSEERRVGKGGSGGGRGG